MVVFVRILSNILVYHFLFIRQGGPMKKSTGVFLLLISAMIAFLYVTPVCAAGETQQQSKSSLSSGDCVKCHETQTADIEMNATKHKTSVTCQDCHPGHRPASKNNIPSCNQCHQGKRHYEEKNCLVMSPEPALAAQDRVQDTDDRTLPRLPYAADQAAARKPEQAFAPKLHQLP